MKMHIRNIIKPSSKFKIIVGFCCLLLFSSCNVYYNLFYADPVKCFDAAKEIKPYDVIIVPGFPHDSGRVNTILSERIKWAYYLYENGYTKNIIFSGSAVYSPYVEAKVMRLLALEIGIKDKHIFIETKAEHTVENLYYSLIKAKELGFNTVAFATEASQASFMKPFKRKYNLDVDFLPIVMDCIDQISVPLNPINESSAFVPDFVSLKKREGFIKRFRNTRGHKLKKEIRRVEKLKRKNESLK